jgi:hypothetical protein
MPMAALTVSPQISRIRLFMDTTFQIPHLLSISLDALQLM